MNLLEIMPELAKPFPIAEIDFLPKGQFEQNGQIISGALPFADPRAYQDRLNLVCPGEWTSQAQMIVAGDKLVCVATVIICGVPHTDVGEASLKGENAATEAFAQAFKRACSQVGLGRYLYALPKQYIAYDKPKKRFIITPREKIALVKEMYKKAGLLSHFPALAVGTNKGPAIDAPATSEQLQEIGKLAKAQQRKVERPKSYGAAQTLLEELQAVS